MDRKQYKLRNEIKRLENILDYKKKCWEVNYMKKAHGLPVRNWTATANQTSHLLHEAKEQSSQGIRNLKSNLPRPKVYGLGKKLSLPRARRD